LRYFYKLDNFHFTTETEQFLWGNLFQLKFDSAAIGFINNNLNLFPPSKVKSKCGKCGKRVGRTKRKCPKCKSNNIIALPDIDQSEIARNKVGRINAKQFTFHAPSLKMDIEGDGFFVDEKIQCRRVFTSVTSTKRELREFLRYNNKPLCEVDIHASQPLIAMSLYSGDYYSAGKGKRVRFSLPLAPLLVIVREPCWTDTGTTRIKHELERWRDLYPSQQSDKDFYDNFSALAGEKFNRETVKALLVRECFNALNAYSKEGIRLKKQFVKMFPLLAYNIDIIKGAVEYREGTLIEGVPIPEHAIYNGLFGVKMQNIEADIMINGVCDEIRREHDFFVTPIHDAVMVEADNVPIVTDMIERHTHEAIGVWPKVSVKNHDVKKSLTQSA
jgi:phage FluMu protein Com